MLESRSSFGFLSYLFLSVVLIVMTNGCTGDRDSNTATPPPDDFKITIYAMDGYPYKVYGGNEAPDYSWYKKADTFPGFVQIADLPDGGNHEITQKYKYYLITTPTNAYFDAITFSDGSSVVDSSYDSMGYYCYICQILNPELFTDVAGGGPDGIFLHLGFGAIAADATYSGGFILFNTRY